MTACSQQGLPALNLVQITAPFPAALNSDVRCWSRRGCQTCRPCLAGLVLLEPVAGEGAGRSLSWRWKLCVPYARPSLKPPQCLQWMENVTPLPLLCMPDFQAGKLGHDSMSPHPSSGAQYDKRCWFGLVSCFGAVPDRGTCPELHSQN